MDGFVKMWVMIPNHEIGPKSDLGSRFNLLAETGSEWAETRMVSLWKLNHLEELDLALTSYIVRKPSMSNNIPHKTIGSKSCLGVRTRLIFITGQDRARSA